MLTKMKMKIEEEKNTIEVLPEECIANILLLTSPVDSCKFSIVSKDFCSASESDIVWDHFLPSDLISIISESQSGSSLLATSPSKKSLYLTLSDNPIIVDNGKKSFQLEKQSGKKIYMLGARDLSIAWGDTPCYWEWITLPESRFQEVSRLHMVCWFEIYGKIHSRVLSSNTQYAAFVVYKMIYPHNFNPHGVGSIPVELTIDKFEDRICTKEVWLDPNYDKELDDELLGLESPKLRSDGWLEVEIGEFNSSLQDQVFQIGVVEIRNPHTKCGFILEGIEIRPKN
ncbi:putative F-box protein PP2-B12 [Vicia villosa]|uniref:putative F-box protein PP2-B12 n=1 Tax=Vicia villosa TaxID=3911 RepID=UPI00273B5945|nr:putative F-box protein PP2-B12 [Vicia villosa]